MQQSMSVRGQTEDGFKQKSWERGEVMMENYIHQMEFSLTLSLSQEVQV